jgi:DNA-binding NarL/FixJ family response regulator
MALRRTVVRILIADDHPVVRRGLRDIVAQEQDMTVIGEAKSGDEALEMARTIEWDVAVLDTRCRAAAARIWYGS